MLNDVRYACRAIRRSPGLAFAAILCIGLAVGANAAVFALADALFLRPLDIPDADGLVTLTTVPSDDDGRLSYQDFVDVRRASRSFSDVTALRPIRAGMAPNAQTQPELRIGFAVSAGFFETFGVQPRLGRAFRADEDRVPARDAVVILGEDLWTREFGADAGIVGRHVRLNAVDYEVVGVVPDAFAGLFDLAYPSFFVPLMMTPSLEAGSDELTNARRRAFTVKGRLRPGISPALASAEVAGIFARLATERPDTNRGVTAEVITELESRVAGNPYTPRLLGVLGMLTIVLLMIACGNIANLMLSRATARTREIGVRLALGASKRRLLRQLMTESFVLALGGGVAATMVTWGAITLFRIYAPSSGLDVPTPFLVRLDARGLVLMFFIAAGSAVVFGLAPALRALRTDLLSSMKPGAAAGSRERLTGRSMLVVVQIAGSVVLLVAATQMIRGFAHVLGQDPGFRTDHRLTMRLDPSLAGYSPERTAQFYRALTAAAATVPGVRSVALTSSLPTVAGFVEVPLVPEGFTLPSGRDSISIASSSVDDKYFSTLGVGIVRGRGFLETDTADAPAVAVVDQTFADRYLAGNPIGKRLRLTDSGKTAVVVGVSVASRHNSIFIPPQTFLYLPVTQRPLPRMTLIAETGGDPAAAANALREVVRSIDVTVPIYRVETMEQLFSLQSVAVARFVGGLTSAVGLVGLALALIGLYAVISYEVSRRTREIGIRIALGAGRSAVIAMVVRQAAAIGVVGVVVGAGISFAGGRGLSAAFDAPPFDPRLFVLVPAMLLVAALLAAAVPARRASSIDPQRALRQD